NRLGSGNSLIQLAGLACDDGRFDRSARLYDQCLPPFREIGDPSGIAAALAGLGLVSWIRGDHTQALVLHGQSLDHFKQKDENTWPLACMPVDTASLASLRRAARRHEERLHLPQEVWAKVTLADGLWHLGRLARRRGDLEQAKALIGDSLALH